MERTRYYVGPPWPPCRGLYDYTLSLCLSDLAWEYMRRNTDYQRDYQIHCQGCTRPCPLRCGLSVQQLHKRSVRACAWHLHSFRRPVVASTRGTPLLAPLRGRLAYRRDRGARPRRVGP